jgi:hypothetical protein
MVVFAAATFVVFSVGVLLIAWRLVARDIAHPVAAFVVRPYAPSKWAWLWAVPLRFGRKLWFALLMSAWNFSDPSPDHASALALVVLVSLMVMLALQLWLRPYADPRDNTLEVCCIGLLLYAYFLSVLRHAPAVASTSVSVLEVALAAYAVYRWCHGKCRHRLQSSRGPAHELVISASDEDDRSEDSEDKPYVSMT